MSNEKLARVTEKLVNLYERKIRENDPRSAQWEIYCKIVAELTISDARETVQVVEQWNADEARKSIHNLYLSFFKRYQDLMAA